MPNELKFHRNVPVERFKSEFELSDGDIQVGHIEGSNKLFFTVPSIEFNGDKFQGPCSRKFDHEGDWEFAYVSDPDAPAKGKWWMLQNPGGGKFVSVASK